MQTIDHLIADGTSGGGGGGRTGEVFDPNTGLVQARMELDGAAARVSDAFVIPTMG